MWLSAVISSLHLLALGIGLGSVFMRGRYLRSALGPDDIKKVLMADNFWGIAALLWIGTGLWRAFGGLEKGTYFYLYNGMFHAKMTLLALVMALEIWPMVTFIRWRITLAKGGTPELRHVRAFQRINDLETVGVIAIVFCASLMARGFAMFS